VGIRLSLPAKCDQGNRTCADRRIEDHVNGTIAPVAAAKSESGEQYCESEAIAAPRLSSIEQTRETRHCAGL
jgi:hypothetical protein